MNNSAGFTHVVDLSVAYEGCRERPSEKSVFWNGDCPSDMHVLVESATAETVAVDSELFLRDSFLRKEALFQEWFARGGDEVLGSRGNSSGWYSPVRTEEEEETSFQRAYAAVSCSEKVVSSPGKGNKSRSSEKNTSIVRVRYDGGPTIYFRHDPDVPGKTDDLRRLNPPFVPGPSPSYAHAVVTDFWAAEGTPEFEAMWKKTESGPTWTHTP